MVAIAILILLLLSGLFSGSETALTATSKARMHRLEQDGNERAHQVNILISNRERLIGAILLGNNLVNILASALATTLFLTLFGQAGVLYATFFMTALVVIFAEVLPKTYAITNAERSSMAVAPVIRLVVVLFAPVVAAISWVVRKTLRAFGYNIDEDTSVLSAHEEIRGAIDLHMSEGGVDKEHRDMLGGILDLNDLQVEEVMVHRKSMRMIDADLPNEDIVEQMLSSPFTRVPLWQGQQENIVGVLHAKDLLRAMRDVSGDVPKIDILDIANEPWFVPETTGLQEQLNAFLSQRNHFALVVDEYGVLMGLITLEDILEEIVGEIVDEHDIEHAGIRPHPNGTFNIDGAIAIRDLNRLLDWDLPDEEATTLAGLVIHEAKTIPEQGQAFNFYGFKFEILRKHRNQITAVRVTPPMEQSSETET
ncbi:MAG: HlyC/CorC family transporter [Alphaproteobacteria bacterium]|nr:MAG: HlyC/CorC family transporter [Alphaproteobacteria bacterium]